MCSIHHRCRIGRVVLPVGVEGDDVAGTAREGRLKAGLQRRALAEVDGVGSGKGTRSAREGSSVIGRRVIDDEHTREKGANARDDAPDHGRLVKRGDDHPRVGAHLHSISVAHRDGRAPIVLGIREGGEHPDAHPHA